MVEAGWESGPPDQPCAVYSSNIDSDVNPTEFNRAYSQVSVKRITSGAVQSYVHSHKKYIDLVCSAKYTSTEDAKGCSLCHYAALVWQ